MEIKKMLDSIFGNIWVILAIMAPFVIALYTMYYGNKRELKIKIVELGKYDSLIKFLITNTGKRSIVINECNISRKNESQDILKQYWQISQKSNLGNEKNPELPYTLDVDKSISFYCEFNYLKDLLNSAIQDGMFTEKEKFYFNLIDTVGGEYKKLYLKNVKHIINHQKDALKEKLKLKQDEAEKVLTKIKNLRQSILKVKGVLYEDYVTQIIYLKFLKIEDVLAKHFERNSLIPEKFNWDKLKDLSAGYLKTQYIETLSALSEEDGIIGSVYKKAQNKIKKADNLKCLVSLIDKNAWLDFDVYAQFTGYGNILENKLIENNAEAAQYFTPRPLIKAIVDVMRPSPEMRVSDPACGTGGFLIATYDYMRAQIRAFLKMDANWRHGIYGQDINPLINSLCYLNIYLHGNNEQRSKVCDGDSLMYGVEPIYDMVLTHPPFSSGNDEYNRGDFTEKICNKQIAFLQHVMTILKTNGRAAMLIPDAVLCDGGASENIRRKLLDEFNLHTVLRLPRGILYEEAIEAHVIFFDKPSSLGNGHGTNDIWVYDCRTNNNLGLPANPLSAHHLADFVKCYNADNICSRKESERFKKYNYNDVFDIENTRLDITWLKDKSFKK